LRSWVPRRRDDGMKCYRYKFYISYGEGQGIIFAKDEISAKDLLKSGDVYGSNEPDFNEFEISEIDMRIPQLIDFGWSE